MNWNEYRQEIDRAEFDPAFRQRVMRALTAAQQGGKEQNRMKKTKTGLERVLIAAAVLIFATVGGFAISASLRQSARRDMGVSQKDAIAEWREYGDAAPAGQEPEGGGLELVSTMCSGDTCEAYVLVSGVDAALAAEIDNERVYWEVGRIDTNRQNATVGARQVAYDADTQQALVRVSATSPYFETARTLEMELVLYRGLEQDRVCGPISIPITQSQSLMCSVSLPVSAGGFDGALTGVRVYAGYVELTGTIPSLAEAGIDAQELDQVDAYIGSWYEAVNAVLADAELVYADGTRAVIGELPSPLTGKWNFSGNELSPVEQGELRLRHVCSQALDLSGITGIQIAGELHSLTE